MATRSTIKVEGINYVKIYQHWDGDPDNMLTMLEAFNEDFEHHRPKDPEYKIAQLTGHLLNSEYTGHGLVKYDADCGQDYEYTLHEDGSVSYVGTYED
jgi:hypothetical protein